MHSITTVVIKPKKESQKREALRLTSLNEKMAGAAPQDSLSANPASNPDPSLPMAEQILQKLDKLKLLDPIAAEITEIKKKLDEVAKVGDENRAAISMQASELKKTNKEVRGMAKEMYYLKTKVIDLENRQRRANLRLRNFPEQMQGDLKLIIVDWLSKDCKITISEAEVERIHWVNAGPHRKDILLRFNSERRREEIYQELRKNKDLKFRGTKVWVLIDLPPAVLRGRAELKEITDTLQAKNQKFSWGLGSSTLLVFKDSHKYIAKNKEQGYAMLKALGIFAAPPSTASSSNLSSQTPSSSSSPVQDDQGAVGGIALPAITTSVSDINNPFSYPREIVSEPREDLDLASIQEMQRKLKRLEKKKKLEDKRVLPPRGK